MDYVTWNNYSKCQVIRMFYSHVDDLIRNNPSLISCNSTELLHTYSISYCILNYVGYFDFANPVQTNRNVTCKHLAALGLYLFWLEITTEPRT
jgi:hypothetical protein